jgi:hypothetical protein
MASRGPVDYVVIAFPGNRFKGEIVPAVAELVDNDVVRIIGVLNDEDLELAAEALEPDSSAALIVWEHRWAARVAQAIRDAGGRIVAGERVPDEIVEQALAGLATG